VIKHLRFFKPSQIGMSRTATLLLNNFLRMYENPIPYIPQTRILRLTLRDEPSIEPLVTSYNSFDIGIPSTSFVVAEASQGPTGPSGRDGKRFSSITQNPVLITPIVGGIVMLEVGTYLSYIYGTPVYVSSAEIYTNNFKGTILAYDSETGYMTIGNISAINGSFGTTETYTINAQVLTSIGSQGPQGVSNFGGFMGANGPTGPTGPQVPFSGGNAAFIAISMFQYGFDCGDVLD
jgi:hypothetical protein